MIEHTSLTRRDFFEWTSKGALAIATGALAAPLTQAAFQTRKRPDLGVGANMQWARPFPDDNVWNKDISALPVDPNSANLIASIGLNTGLHPDFGTQAGIPYVVIPGTQPRVPVTFDFAEDSDAGPYPIPANPPIEGGAASTGDRHILMVDRDNWKLYETWSSYPQPDGSWHCGSGAIFDLNSNALRPAGFGSADAAGLPIFPGLVRYDEVVLHGAILHALRFTVQRTRRAYVFPARHWASSLTSANLPPMGMRVRLKSSFNMSSFPLNVRVILVALQIYGMMVSDNGGNWFITGAPDSRWSDDELSTLRNVHGHDFEVVQMGPVTAG